MCWLIRFKSRRQLRNIHWIHGGEEARLPSALDSKSSWKWPPSVIRSCSQTLIQHDGCDQSIRDVFCTLLCNLERSELLQNDLGLISCVVFCFYFRKWNWNRNCSQLFLKLIFLFSRPPDNLVCKSSGIWHQNIPTRIAPSSSRCIAANRKRMNIVYEIGSTCFNIMSTLKEYVASHKHGSA